MMHVFNLFHWLIFVFTHGKKKKKNTKGLWLKQCLMNYNYGNILYNILARFCLEVFSKETMNNNNNNNNNNT